MTKKGLPRCARNDRKKIINDRKRIGNNKEGMSLRGAESDVAIPVGWQNGDCHIPLASELAKTRGLPRFARKDGDCRTSLAMTERRLAMTERGLAKTERGLAMTERDKYIILPQQSGVVI